MKEFIKVLFDVLFIILVSGIAFVMVIIFSVVVICEYLIGIKSLNNYEN